jgi:hypothetical protein
MPLLVGLFLAKGKITNPAYRKGLLFIAPVLCLLIGYYFYFGSGVTQYGPRYLYESYALILIPAAMGLLATKRWAPWALGVLLVFNSLMFLKQTDIYRETTEEHVKFFKLANQLNNAVIFIHASNIEYSRYFLRNGLDFNGPVLLALDRGTEQNQALIRRYPARSFYICNFHVSGGNSLFEPYMEKAQ